MGDRCALFPCLGRVAVFGQARLEWPVLLVPVHQNPHVADRVQSVQTMEVKEGDLVSLVDK